MPIQAPPSQMNRDEEKGALSAPELRTSELVQVSASGATGGPGYRLICRSV